MLALYPVVRFNSPFVAWRTVAVDSNTVCSALRTAEELSKWMPVFAYEIDFGDVGTALTGGIDGRKPPWLARGTRPLVAQIRFAHHCGFWDEVTPEH